MTVVLSVVARYRIRSAFACDERELDFDVNGSRIPFLPVGALIPERKARRVVVAAAPSDLPHPLVETDVPTVEMMLSLVSSEPVCRAVDDERAA
jgi:hypothetical protein